MNCTNIDTTIEQLLVLLTEEVKRDETSNKTGVIFPLTLTLQALTLSKNRPSAQNIADMLFQQIIKTKSAHWTWSYTAEQSKYPDDLDDTCCAIAAFIDWQKISETEFPEMLASITKTLIRQEVTFGGPYFTWIMKDREHNDIDIGVNANIQYMLSKLHISLPELTTYIDQHIDERRLNSLYYHNKILSLYFITRGYYGDKKQQLINQIRECIQIDSPISHYILAAISLIRLGESLGSVADIIDRIDIEEISNKNRDLTPLYVEKIHENVTEYATSYIFEISILIELLELIRAAPRDEICSNQKFGQLNTGGDTQIARQKSLEQKIIENRILRRLEQEKHKIPRVLQDEFEKHLLRLRNSRHWHEIILLPYSLTKSRSSIDIGAMSALAWIAYTIDDEIMDSPEADYVKNVKLLPLSRLLHRHICENTYFQSNTWRKSLDEMDAAHYLELCGIQTSIVQKSFGHALPALLAIDARTNLAKTSKMYAETFTQCLKKYIAARQLSDDAHDWKEDLALKRSTPVTEILRHHANRHTTHGEITEDIHHLESIFWKKCAKNIATNILKQSMKSLELAARCERIDSTIHLEYLKTHISRYTRIAQTMLQEVDQAEQFSTAYSGNMNKS
ncbi:MAG: hypothetical protein RIT04_462 [Candidatus Parcubacteria bacterium]|jgi:hypothetical protein